MKKLRQGQESTTASILPSGQYLGSITEQIERALEEGRQKAIQLANELPKQAPQTKSQGVALERGHLEALKRIRLSENARNFLRAFSAIDIFFSDAEVARCCNDTKGALAELTPHFQKYGVKCIRTGSGWSITKNLSAQSN